MKGPLALLRRVLGQRSSDDDSIIPLDAAPPERVDPEAKQAADDALGRVLAEMERAALEVYRRHDLPTEPGHYAWSGASGRRRFLGEDISPEERWSLYLAQPEGSSWRFTDLAGLGALEGRSEDLTLASHVLRTCAEVRRSIGQTTTADAVAQAIRLGAEWPALRRRLIDAEATGAVIVEEKRPALRFTPPDEIAEPADDPEPEPGPAPKPRAGRAPRRPKA